MLYEYNPGDLSMKTWDEPAQELLKRGMKLGLLANDSADAMMRYQRQSGYSSLKVFDAASRYQRLQNGVINDVVVLNWP